MALTVIGNSTRLTPAGATTANVGNVATKTNTFHVVNASSTVYAYVGVFSTYAEAAAMDHPQIGSDGGGLILTPNESQVLIGNFGLGQMANQANVYVSAVTATGTRAREPSQTVRTCRG